MTDTLGEDRLLDEETAIQQVLDGAFDEISRICKERWDGKEGWRTSIPAQRGYDSDLILADALLLAKQSVARLCARVRHLEAERDATQRLTEALRDRSKEWRELAKRIREEAARTDFDERYRLETKAAQLEACALGIEIVGAGAPPEGEK